MSLLSIKNLCVTLGRHRILDAIDLEVERGEIVTLVGPNGSGKSTLLRSIIGAVSPTSGRIHRQQGCRIGYVPQRLSLDPTLPMTVVRFLNLPHRHSRAAVANALAQAGIPGVEQQQIADLSGGQFQRILLARALMDSPDILLLDEATQGLDHRGIADFYRQIDRVRHTLGCGVLMVSHELHVVMRASDRVVCLHGHVCCQGTPERVMASPAYQDLFGLDTADALAFYRHEHSHDHSPAQSHNHSPAQSHNHSPSQSHDHSPSQSHDHSDSDSRTHSPADAAPTCRPSSGPAPAPAPAAKPVLKQTTQSWEPALQLIAPTAEGCH